MKRLISMLVLVLPLVAAGQKSGGQFIDSALMQLPKMKEDTNKLSLYYEIGRAYLRNDNDQGIKYGREGLTLATKIGSKKYTGMMYSVIGVNYISKGVLDSALNYSQKACKIFEQINDKGLANNEYNNMGMVYYASADYPKALETYFKSLKLAEEAKNETLQASTLINIGGIYDMIGDHDKSFVYFQKALKIAERIKDDEKTILCLSNIGNHYYDKPEGENYFLKALQLSIKSGNKGYTGLSYRGLAGYYEGLGKYDKAVENYNQAISYLADAYEVAYATGSIGKVYLAAVQDSGVVQAGKFISANKVSNLRMAAEYTSKALKMYQQIGDVEGIKQSYHNFVTIYKLTNNYKSALENYELYTHLNDSIFSLENHEKITNLETQREKELKDKQIQIDKLEVAKKRNTNIFLGAGIVFLLGVVVVVVKERKKSDRLLLNILPGEVAKELKAKGDVDAKLFDDVTVLFTDFVSFTKVAEKLTPKQLVAELHTCFKAFDEIMARHNIEKIKTVGDAYLAVAGLPNATPAHAQKIVKAALEIRDFMLKRKEELGDMTFAIRLGVHSGNVVAGIVGIKKFAYDIWGDTVNTAARMEQNSEAGKVNISQTTYDLVKDEFTCSYRGEIDAKNKGMLSMYFVEG